MQPLKALKKTVSSSLHVKSFARLVAPLTVMWEKQALLYFLQLLAQSVNPPLHVFVRAAAAMSDTFATQLLRRRETRRV